MTDWVALLRGVNVGGVTIRNAPLADVFETLGLADVRPVLASGNVTFSDGRAGEREGESVRAELTSRIQRGLRSAFGYDAWIILVSRAELARAADGFPFDETDEGRQPWVIFCVAGAREELLEASKEMDAAVDPVAAGPGVVYWHPKKGRSTDTPFAKVIARTAYRTRTTNRNLRTLRRILG